MDKQINDHIKLVCSLNVGDVVETGIAGYKTKGETTITDIKFENNCDSGVLVKTGNYDRWHDSTWIKKITNG